MTALQKLRAIVGDIVYHRPADQMRVVRGVEPNGQILVVRAREDGSEPGIHVWLASDVALLFSAN